jgi:hypothetical protein
MELGGKRMDLIFNLFMGLLGLILIGSVAFIGLSFYVGWTGYTHVKDEEN